MSHNPLNEFTPEQLVAELRRRGMTVAAFAEGTIAAQMDSRLIETALQTLAEIRHYNDLADFEREHLSGLQVTVADEVLELWQADDLDDDAPAPDAPTPPAAEHEQVNSGFIDRFLSEGDPLHSGGVVGYGHVGVRLVGDTELVGTDAALANFGQAFIDRFRPDRFALAVGTVGGGFTMYGPCAPEEDGAELKILGLVDESDAYEFVTLHPLVARRHA